MKIVFLTLVRISSIEEKGIYTDLLRKFRNEGHQIFIACPNERRYSEPTRIHSQNGVSILQVRTLNILNTSFLEKGISTLLMEQQFINAIKKHFADITFDLVLYSTPPVTFFKVVKFIMKRDNARSYLLLKDIFPQNAVDMGFLKKGGLIHRYFRNLEKGLYRISDFIGCMSEANVNYLLKHNPGLNPLKVEVNPNSIEIYNTILSEKEKISIREQFGIPGDKVIFLYGGNLGKPQGVDFILEVISHNDPAIFFMITGSGTEYNKLQKWISSNRPTNVKLIPYLPREEYDRLTGVCDVGMIFLDPKFTIPNFPSRLLSYLACKLPVIAATDINTDLGSIMEENGFGFWCKSGDLETMRSNMNRLKSEILRKSMGEKGYRFLLENYSVERTYSTIMRHFDVQVF